MGFVDFFAKKLAIEGVFSTPDEKSEKERGIFIKSFPTTTIRSLK